MASAPAAISRPVLARHPIPGLPQKAAAMVRQARPFGNGLILAVALRGAARCKNPAHRTSGSRQSYGNACFSGRVLREMGNFRPFLCRCLCNNVNHGPAVGAGALEGAFQ
jgi:hypothetical protein